MGKKNLSVDGLINELKGGSSFFPSKQPEITPVEEKTIHHGNPPHSVPSERSIPISYLNSFGGRKIKSRHPFDIYEDQLYSLKQISYEDKLNGGTGSMSAMVREALDDYLKKKKKRKQYTNTPIT